MKASRRYEHLREDERKAVLEAREHVATVNSYPKCEEGSAIDEIARKFRRYNLWQFLPTDPSIQRVILDATPDGKNLHEDARQGSRRLLFDLAFDIVCGPGISTREDTLKYSKARTRLILARRWGLFDEDVAEYADCVRKKLISDGLDVLKEILSESDNAQRRKNTGQLDTHALVMARHWVNPHCPLWMMSLPVLQSVLPAIAKDPISADGKWSPDTIRKRIAKLKKAGACRFPGEPIFDVRLRTKPDVGAMSESERVQLAKLQKDSDQAVEAFKAGARSAKAIKEMIQKVNALQNAKVPNAEDDSGSGRVVEQFSVCVKNTLPPMQNPEYCIELRPRKPRFAKGG